MKALKNFPSTVGAILSTSMPSPAQEVPGIFFGQNAGLGGVIKITGDRIAGATVAGARAARNTLGARSYRSLMISLMSASIFL
jgi:hypothetical protein